MAIDENDLGSRFSATKRNTKKLIQQLNDLLQVKWSDKGSLSKLAKISKKIPPGSTCGQAVDEIRRDLEAIVNQAQDERRKAFGASEARFLKNLESTAREIADGWRIGSVELELKREEAKARVCYNHYPIESWFPVNSADDLQTGLTRALVALEKSKISVEKFTEALESGYRYLLMEAKRTQLVNTRTVPIRDLYREVRVALARMDLLKKPSKKLTAIEFPEWAFVFNLDLFIAAGAKTPGWRMSFQTGSQAEQQRGIGMTTNGLRSDTDYRVFCYVELSKQS